MTKIPANRDPRRFPYRLWNNARQRSLTLGTQFSITREWVEEQIKEGRCAVSGIPFDIEYRTGRARPFAPSLDQITPGGGYTPENTQMVVWIYNSAKNNGTHEDVLRLARALILPHVEQSDAQ